MTDAEHEEWLRDRAEQKASQKKHTAIGGLQVDAPEDANLPARTDVSDADEEEDDDDESESDGSTSIDVPAE